MNRIETAHLAGAGRHRLDASAHIRYAELPDALTSDTWRPDHASMGATDEALNQHSRELLSEIDELKALELKKRRTTRSTHAFHRLAEDIEHTARQVFKHSAVEEAMARDDSPVPEERYSTQPGDWTSGREN